MERWTKVRLGDVLTRSTNAVIPNNELNYKLVTVKMHNKGVTLRREVNGSEIKSTRMFFVQSEQFILSRIDARNGAFGIIPPELNDALVTNDFPVFNIQRNRIDLGFLKWMVRTQDFIDMCKRASEGTTNRVRLKEDKFLNLAVPLPPLPEQHRIVVKIEELTDKIEEAKGLRRKAIEEAEKVIQNSFYTITNVYNTVSFEETIEKLDFHIGKIKKRDFRVNGQYPVIDQGQLFIAGYSDKQKSLYDGPLPVVIFGDHTKTVKFVNFRFIQGADGIRILLPQKDVVVPKYLYYCIKFIDLEDRGYNRHYKVLKESKIPLPNHEEQRRIASYLDNLQAKIDSLKCLQLETQSELDALIPSILAKAFRGEL